MKVSCKNKLVILSSAKNFDAYASEHDDDNDEKSLAISWGGKFLIFKKQQYKNL